MGSFLNFVNRSIWIIKHKKCANLELNVAIFVDEKQGQREPLYYEVPYINVPPLIIVPSAS